MTIKMLIAKPVDVNALSSRFCDVGTIHDDLPADVEDALVEAGEAERIPTKPKPKGAKT